MIPQPLQAVSIDIPKKQEHAQELFSNKIIREHALGRLQKIHADQQKMQTLIRLYNRQEPNYKPSIIEVAERILKHIDPDDFPKEFVKLETNILHDFFFPLQKDCNRLIHALKTPLEENLDSLRLQKNDLSQLLFKEQNTIKDSPNFTNFIKKLRKEIADVNTYTPRVYFAYAWPHEKYASHEKWIQPFLKCLRKQLTDAGTKVELDIVTNRYGANIYEFMRQCESTDFVILFGSESLKEKLDGGLSAVCTELIHILRKRIADNFQKKKRVFPILISGTHANSFPTEYERFITVRDWRTTGYINAFETLYLELNGHPPADYLDQIEHWWEECLDENPDLKSHLDQIGLERKTIINRPLEQPNTLSPVVRPEILTLAKQKMPEMKSFIANHLEMGKSYYHLFQLSQSNEIYEKAHSNLIEAHYHFMHEDKPAPLHACAPYYLAKLHLKKLSFSNANHWLAIASEKADEVNDIETYVKAKLKQIRLSTLLATKEETLELFKTLEQSIAERPCENGLGAKWCILKARQLILTNRPIAAAKLFDRAISQLSGKSDLKSQKQKEKYLRWMSFLKATIYSKEGTNFPPQLAEATNTYSTETANILKHIKPEGKPVPDIYINTALGHVRAVIASINHPDSDQLQLSHIFNLSCTYKQSMIRDFALKHLARLSLIGQHLSMHSIKAMHQSLTSAHSIRDIDFSGSLTDHALAEPVAQLLSACPRLTSLSLENNQLTGEHARLIIQGMGSCVHLISVNLSNNQLNCKDIEFFCQMVTKLQKISDINLSNNAIAGNGSGQLTEILESCKMLSKVSVKGNPLDTIGIEAFKALKVSKPNCQVDYV